MPVTTAVDYFVDGLGQGRRLQRVWAGVFHELPVVRPSLQIVAEPAQPTSATVTVALSMSKILGEGREDAVHGQGRPRGRHDQVQDRGLRRPDRRAHGASARGGADGGADAATSEGGADAGTDGGALADAASDAEHDAGALADALGADGSAMRPRERPRQGTRPPRGDAADGAAPATSMPGAPVPAVMNMGPVTITFNNLVDGDAVKAQITVTEDGKPFADFTVDTTKAPTLTLTPKTAWAAGKLYVVKVGKAAADLVGDTLGMDQTAAFMMAN